MHFGTQSEFDRVVASVERGTGSRSSSDHSNGSIPSGKGVGSFLLFLARELLTSFLCSIKTSCMPELKSTWEHPGVLTLSPVAVFVQGVETNDEEQSSGICLLTITLKVGGLPRPNCWKSNVYDPQRSEVLANARRIDQIDIKTD